MLAFNSINDIQDLYILFYRKLLCVWYDDVAENTFRMPRYMRNSRYNKIFLLIGIGAVVFISFQLLSLKVLSKSARHKSSQLIEEFEEDNHDGKFTDHFRGVMR